MMRRCTENGKALLPLPQPPPSISDSPTETSLVHGPQTSISKLSSRFDRAEWASHAGERKPVRVILSVIRRKMFVLPAETRKTSCYAASYGIEWCVVFLLLLSGRALAVKPGEWSGRSWRSSRVKSRRESSSPWPLCFFSRDIFIDHGRFDSFLPEMQHADS